jgi:hypothetical protein
LNGGYIWAYRGSLGSDFASFSIGRWVKRQGEVISSITGIDSIQKISTEEHHFLTDAQNIASNSMIAKALLKRAAAVVVVPCVYNQSHCLWPVIVSGVAI